MNFKRLFTLSVILNALMVGLYFFGIRFRGLYTELLIAGSLAILSLLYFIVLRFTIRRLREVVVALPLLLFSLAIVFFDGKKGIYAVKDSRQVVVTSGGMLSCGEILNFVETEMGIFAKEYYHETSLCLTGITGIKVAESEDGKDKLLIFHDRKNDSENPYHYLLDEVKYSR